jgi:hypothetical protein
MEANWKPLELRLGRSRCVGFMYMGRVNGINLYKHGISRTYLNLDDEGHSFVKRRPGCYIQVDFELELERLEKVLKSLQATLETTYDELFIARKRQALRELGISLLRFKLNPKTR